MPRDRNYNEELRQARERGDWEAHARIWEERRLACVEAEESQLGPHGFSPSEEK